LEQPSDGGQELGSDWPPEIIECLSTLTVALQRWLDAPSSDPQALLTAEQVGDLLQLSPRTLKEQASAGQIPHHRLGKHYRFSRSDIDAILELAQAAVATSRRRIGAEQGRRRLMRG
jgi:excisionase family DNA binding protein